MKIAALSCTYVGDQLNGRNDAARDTWVKTWGHMIDFRYFYPNNRVAALPDEIVTDTPDTGDRGIPFQSHAAHVWAVENDYDYAYICCPDIYPVVPRLLTCGFEWHDCIGRLCPEGHLSGAPGFMVSRRALKVLAASKPYHEYDDLRIYRALVAGGINITHDTRFWADNQHGPPFPYDRPGCWTSGGGVVALHLGRGTNTFNPQWMRDCHRSYLAHEGATGC